MSATVVDASLLVAAVADDGPEGHWAEEVLAEATPLAPHLARVEVTNILRRLELAGSLTERRADSARRLINDLDLELFPFEPFADRIWQLRKTITSCDPWYVAIAETIDAPLATLDRRLARATGSTCSFLLPD